MSEKELIESTTKNDLGFIFREKYGRDPDGLSLEEIDEVVFGDEQPPTLNEGLDIISCRGDVFNTIDLGDPGKLVDELLQRC